MKTKLILSCMVISCTLVECMVPALMRYENKAVVDHKAEDRSMLLSEVEVNALTNISRTLIHSEPIKRVNFCNQLLSDQEISLLRATNMLENEFSIVEVVEQRSVDELSVRLKKYTQYYALLEKLSIVDDAYKKEIRKRVDLCLTLGLEKFCNFTPELQKDVVSIVEAEGSFWWHKRPTYLCKALLSEYCSVTVLQSSSQQDDEYFCSHRGHYRAQVQQNRIVIESNPRSGSYRNLLCSLSEGLPRSIGCMASALLKLSDRCSQVRFIEVRGQPQQICWSPDDACIVALFDDKVAIYSVSDGALLSSLDLKQPVQFVRWEVAQAEQYLLIRTKNQVTIWLPFLNKSSNFTVAEEARLEHCGKRVIFRKHRDANVLCIIDPIALKMHEVALYSHECSDKYAIDSLGFNNDLNLCVYRRCPLIESGRLLLESKVGGIYVQDLDTGEIKFRKTNRALETHNRYLPYKYCGLSKDGRYVFYVRRDKHDPNISWLELGDVQTNETQAIMPLAKYTSYAFSSTGFFAKYERDSITLYEINDGDIELIARVPQEEQFPETAWSFFDQNKPVLFNYNMTNNKGWQQISFAENLLFDQGINQMDACKTLFLYSLLRAMEQITISDHVISMLASLPQTVRKATLNYAYGQSTMTWARLYLALTLKGH